MKWYKYIIIGTSLFNNKKYISTCECLGMSEYEKEEWIKENNFDPKTVSIAKISIRSKKETQCLSI